MRAPPVENEAPVLDIDGGALRDAWGKVAFRFSHRLAASPLLSSAALASLADRVPAASIEHHLADLPLLLPEGNPDRLKQTPGEVARGIAGNGSWMMFSLQRTDAYDELLGEVARAVRWAAAERSAALDGGSITIFLASPGASVPVHFDRHHNFLLHVAGVKTVTMGKFLDPRDEQVEIERNFSPERHNSHRIPEQSWELALEPGNGLYIPPYAFHWVTGGSDVAVSVSCSFRSPETLRRQLVHQCNAGLRRFGIRPRPPEQSRLRDQTKVVVLHRGNQFRDFWRRRSA